MRGKKTIGKRLLSIAGAVIVSVTMIPTVAFAEDNTIDWQDGKAVYDKSFSDGVAASEIENKTLNESADTYVWNLTSQQTYLPPSGTGGSARHYPSTPAWTSEYSSSTTSDGYIQFYIKVVNNSKDDYQSIDSYHECSQPKTSYAPGEKAVMEMRALAKNNVNYNYFKGTSRLFISGENKEADGVNFGPYVSNNKNPLANFTAEGESSTWLMSWVSSGTYIDARAKVYADFPKSTTEGEHIAIVFLDGSGSESSSLSPQNEYGGQAFHLWIYTLQKVSSPSPTPDPVPETIEVGNTKITKVKKINSKKFRVTWKSVSDITGYQVQLSKNKKFKKAATKSKTTDGKYNYINIKNFPKATWYIRVRAYKTQNGTTTYGKWSAVKKYKWKK